ncbi:MAG: hypothetical protein ACRENP_06215 [Longimicrobiales bacterium]
MTDDRSIGASRPGREIVDASIRSFAPFRSEKLAIIEELGAVTEFFAARRDWRRLPVVTPAKAVDDLESPIEASSSLRRDYMGGI